MVEEYGSMSWRNLGIAVLVMGGIVLGVYVIVGLSWLLCMAIGGNC